LRKLRIPVGQVHSSLFQRAIDTGALVGFGDVKASADFTEGGLVVTPIETNRRAAAKPDGSGGYKLVARIQAGDWSKLAQAMN